ncbi:MAG: hypothetical protein AAFQ76_07900, partial [Cyanobacteria bacterium J06626_26]
RTVHNLLAATLASLLYWELNVTRQPPQIIESMCGDIIALVFWANTWIVTPRSIPGSVTANCVIANHSFE